MLQTGKVLNAAAEKTHWLEQGFNLICQELRLFLGKFVSTHYP